MLYQVMIKETFSSAHALRHYRGKGEASHKHHFRVEVVAEGKKLKNKVKYLIDFIAFREAVRSVVKPLDQVNLNEVPPFTRENPSAENLARYVGQEVRRRWREPGVRVVSVTVWETPEAAARCLF